MKYVDSGSGKIPLITLLAILSISLTVNLPGLGISPIEGKLDQVFPHVTELEIQLLTILPNFVIIPFILFSGKLCTPKNQLFILGLGLVIYTLCGVLYLFASSMIELIIISCLLGVGCGLIIPLAASLIAQNFVGAARTRQLGMKSGCSNAMVIIATLFVGWMADIGWHLSFLVYLVPVIPLALMPFLTDSFIDKHKIVDPTRPAEPKHEAPTPAPTPQPMPPTPNFHFQPKRTYFLLGGIIAFYMVITYATMVVSYYMPFTMQHYKLSTGDVGVATALFFLSATVSGFCLSYIISWLGRKTTFVAIAMCLAGLFVMGFVHIYLTFILGVILMGLGYGVLQPVIYDKTTYIAPSTQKSTEYFSYVLTGNYIAIAMVPFIVGLFARMFNAHGVNFSYILNGSIMILVLIIAVWKQRTFVFNVDPSSYEKPQAPADTRKA